MGIRFEVYGEPVGKGRPRFNFKRGRGYTRVYTPRKTIEYENMIKRSYINAAGGIKFGDNAQLEIYINAYYGIAESKSKRVKEKMRQGEIRPTKKPDIDNVVKSVLDGLNGIAYRDDTQIVSLTCKKIFADEAKIEVYISEV